MIEQVSLIEDTTPIMIDIVPMPASGCPAFGSPWLQAWLDHTGKCSHQLLVPPAATQITTPLNAFTWRCLLSNYPDQPMAQFFLEGIQAGFRIGVVGDISNFKSAKKNLQSAMKHAHVVQEYLSTEVKEGRLAGPFPKSLVPSAHISPFGVIPKSNQPGKWRLIVNLSHPSGYSVNDAIPKELCSISYVTIDDATKRIVELGTNTLLAKIDIKSAFRLIPVHPADRHWLAMEWKGSLLIDTCLPFGLRSAPKLFNNLADLLHWILVDNGVSFLLHYLDDFLTTGAPGSPECQQNLNIIIQVCQLLGIPLAIEKVSGPATILDFLGILLDTVKLEARLPEGKLARVRDTITEWLNKKKATKREILSLVGLLQHAAKVVRPGRSFVSRMYSTAARVPELDYYTRLNREFRSDLYWWHTFLQKWNGVSLLRSTGSQLPDIVIQTDASGSWGCGALCQTQWFQWPWPAALAAEAIMVKEMIPVVLACSVWGPVIAGKTVKFQCDNTGVVAAINKGSAKEPFVMHLLRCLWFFTAHFDIAIFAEHIAGAKNCAADHLSRNNLQYFFSSAPQARLLATPLPPEALEIVTDSSLDWTSPAFRCLFNTILNKV